MVKLSPAEKGEGKAPYSWLGCPVVGSHFSDVFDLYSRRNDFHMLSMRSTFVMLLNESQRRIEKIESSDVDAGSLAEERRNMEELERELAEGESPLLVEHAIPLLGLSSKQCYSHMENDTEGIVCFNRDGYKSVEVEMLDLPDTLNGFTKMIMDSILAKGIELLVGEGVSDCDGLFIDISSGRSYATLTRTKSADGGFIADVSKVSVDTYSAEEGAGLGLIVKGNKSWDVTVREKAILDGIREDPELEALGVSAPSVYEINKRNMCMALAAGCVPVDELAEAEIRRLTPRIVKATQILERNTPKYLSDIVIDEQKFFGDFLSENGEGIRKAEDAQRRVIENTEITEERRERARERYKVLKDSRGEVEEKMRHAKPAMPANEYFDQASWLKEAPVLADMADIGESHAEAISYLSRRGMSSTTLSDSRFSNWLYHRDSNMLYKIDENAPAKGSRYSCIARICDHGEKVPEEERDMIVQGMLDDNDTLNDAFLSLYMMNLRTAYFNKRRCDAKHEPENPFHGMMRGRLRRAKGYLEKIGDERLAEEFEAEVREHFGAEIYRDVYNRMPIMGEVAR